MCSEFSNDAADPHLTLTITPNGVELGSAESGTPEENLAMLQQMMAAGGRFSMAIAKGQGVDLAALTSPD